MGRLWDKKDWDHDGVREWSDVAREAASQGKEIHMGRLFGLCVQKGSELPDGDNRKKYKYRVVFGGNNILDQTWEQTVFQSLGSSPARGQGPARRPPVERRRSPSAAPALRSPTSSGKAPSRQLTMASNCLSLMPCPL